MDVGKLRKGGNWRLRRQGIVAEWSLASGTDVAPSVVEAIGGDVALREGGCCPIRSVEFENFSGA